MPSKDRIYLMTRLADFRRRNQHGALRIVRYERGDYIAVQLVKNLILTTLAYVFLLGLFLASHLNFFLTNMEGSRFGYMMAFIIVLYAAALAVFSIVTYASASNRYGRAEAAVKEYYEQLRILRMNLPGKHSEE